MDIVILDRATLGETNINNIKKLGKVKVYETTPKEEIVNRSKDASIIITNKAILTRDILEKLPKLKLICIAATGTNNIDLQAAKEFNIYVKNVAGYSTDSVTQHTIMCALNFLGQLHYYDNYVKNKEWTKSNIFCHFKDGIEMFNLKDKQWGIIGLGTIGKSVAKIAKAFGANVSYFSTSGNNYSNEFKKIDTLENLIINSNIISIHASLNEKTKNLITKKELKLLKNNAILINMGRGGIVNETDVADIISKRDFYFATDVLEQEPMIDNHPLLNKSIQNKIIITPHIAWAYKESREKLINNLENNIKEFMQNN